MEACSAANSSLLQTESNLASSQAAVPRQMVRLSSHCGSRHALQRPQSKKVQTRVLIKTSRSKSKNMQPTINHLAFLTVAGEGFLVGGEQSVTNLSLRDLIS